MTVFEITDMTCGHCARTIAKAIAAVDEDARLDFDIPRQRVEIQSADASVRDLSDAIEQAGYSPRLASDTNARAADGKAAQRSGCCCGQ